MTSSRYPRALRPRSKPLTALPARLQLAPRGPLALLTSLTPLRSSRHLLAALIATATLTACGGGGDGGGNPGGGNPGRPLDGLSNGNGQPSGPDQPGNPGNGLPGGGEVITGDPPRAWAFRTAEPSQARWSPVQELPQVPAAAANLPDGRILFWAAEDRFLFGDNEDLTYTAIFDPATGRSTDVAVSNTRHNMFCPGTTNLPDGRLLVSGGIGSPKTSLYDPRTNSWSAAAQMNIPRGYQSNVLTADSQVLTLGGSWSGPLGGKLGELWNEAEGWRRLPGVTIEPMLGPDPGGIYRADNHLWLFATGDNRVFHAGPSVNMNWITTGGVGSVRAAGARGGDSYSQNGNAAMYDINRLLKTGGAPAYEGANATRASYRIALGAEATSLRLADMAYPRAFHNSVVLPNGQVVIVGGQTFPVPFSDNTTILVPELWDPVTREFSPMPAIQVPRNYHSVALLMTDGRVLSAGGGLCGAGCQANHPNLQILTPPYLLTTSGSPATQPRITQAPAEAALGTTISVATDAAVASFVLMRMSSTTHTVNNDQRRVPVTHRSTSPTGHSVDIPTNPGIVSPGDYMLFALDANGVPSISRRIRITTAGVPLINPPGPVSSALGAPVDLALTTRGAAASGFSATGLPPGIGLDPATGRFGGTPTAAGLWRTRVTARQGASAGSAASSTEFSWTVTALPAARYVQVEALGDIGNAGWASIAELDVLDATGQALPRGGWTAAASSAEGGHPAAAVIDGNPATWWQSIADGQPHQLTLDLKMARAISGIRLLPRQAAGPTETAGTIGRFRVMTSIDGVDWRAPSAEGDFARWQGNRDVRTVLFDNRARGGSAIQSSTGAGASAARAIDGNPDGDFSHGSVTATEAQANPWWQVDLRQAHTLDAIRLWNRTDCCAGELGNLTIFVSRNDMAGRTLASLAADPTVWRYQIVTEAGRETLIRATARGRYLRVQLNGSGTLALAEVEAYGVADETGDVLLAEGRPVVSELGKAVALPLDGSDSLGGAVTFEASGLPDGLRLDATRGVIGGTPTQVGASVISVGARNTAGHRAETTVLWIVEAARPASVAVSPMAVSGAAVVKQVEGAGPVTPAGSAAASPAAAGSATTSLAAASPAASARPVDTTWQASPFDPPEAIRGAALFYGQGALEGRLAGHARALPVVASRCANCHDGATDVASPGRDGFRINARLDALSLLTSRSRRGGPPSSFDAASLCQVLRSGVDPASVMVDPIMPRFTISDADCQDLWAFLTRRA